MESSSRNADSLRAEFTLALSDMYRQEVPLYDALLQIVHQVDATTKGSSTVPPRHEIERHGAIRLGTEHELRTIKRIFAILGMYPVGYYDLSVVGFPLHATAFRPTDEESLAKNPFRVFTTLLRKDMILPSEVRILADAILSRRNLFSEKLFNLIDCAEHLEANSPNPSFSPQDAHDFITESLKIFQWHSHSHASLQEYQLLHRAHPMIADIVCFPSAHINHLTPRTLDIDLVQQEMIKNGLPAKDSIEGPPGGRKCPILLRQTSFKALEEKVVFCGSGDVQDPGTHTARFGEVEQRGAAVTRKGRQLYDELLELARLVQKKREFPPNSPQAREILPNIFKKFPDEWEELRAQDLVFFKYRLTSSGEHAGATIALVGQQGIRMEQLLSHGLVEYEPITYEDFLPFSAAGIFTSNLVNSTNNDVSTAVPPDEANSGKQELEQALSGPILDDFELYSQMQQRSINACAEALGLNEIVMK